MPFSLRALRLLYTSALLLLVLVGCGGDNSSGAATCSPACAADEVCYHGGCLLSREVPKDPVCYTPCRGGVGCSADGLLKGCIGDAECVRGTCIAPESAAAPSSVSAMADTTGKAKGTKQKLKAGTCDKDSDCADHQACIEGACYSNCESNDDCDKDFLCSRRVCRERCKAAGNDCRPGYACQLTDGSSGACMPLLDSGDQIDAPTGTFTATPATIKFSNTMVSGTLTIKNASDLQERFIIKKLQHTGYTATGSQLVTDDPLSWLTVEAEGAEVSDEGVSVLVDAQGSLKVTLGGAADAQDIESWDGRLLVSNATLGDQEVELRFAGTRAGQWAGNMYFLASDFGEAGLDAWLKNKDNPTATAQLGNAFIRRWVAFRDGRISRRDFEAMLQSTEVGSWAWESVKNRCPNALNPDPNIACYLSDTPSGVSIFSNFLPDAPIPAGVTKFPMVFNVRPDGKNAKLWNGRVVSDRALQYQGNPEISLSFADDTNSCDGTDPNCTTLIDDFAINGAVGGRFLTTPKNTTCSGLTGFKQVQTPWLVDGFTRNTALTGGKRYLFSCQDQLLPFGSGKEFVDTNTNLAGSNPIPDGATRRRSVELIDGAMIGGDAMFVIFRESMPSFFDPAGGEPLRAYGYMWLKRVATNLDDADYAGTAQTDERPAPTLPTDACASWIFDSLKASGGPTSLTDASASDVGIAVVSGQAGTLGAPIDADLVHSFCTESGLFDDKKCPAGSRIDWFTGKGSEVFTSQRIADEPCMATSTCASKFLDWLNGGSIRADLIYTCSSGAVTCDGDKTFYVPGTGAPAFAPLDPEIQKAFRYKTQFKSRDGSTSVGFTPGVCTKNPTEIPYCYDPVAIEAISDRVDCAVHIYVDYYEKLSDGAKTTLNDFLTRNYSYSQDGDQVADGFERLYAELLTMLGDEAYTSAFTARFDLAGQAVSTFEGTLFEPKGINLSGAAGYEMHNLYQATQYYQAALDRFYLHANSIKRSLNDLPAGQGFITQATASSYFDRLLRASSQKSRAWSEVAKRYQSFRQPQLARLVVGRTYTGTYLESVVLSRMLSNLVTISDAADKAQLTAIVQSSQLNYTAALQGLSSVNEDITEDATIFGYAPEYIPFVALDPKDTNAFEKVFSAAEDAVAVAAEKEQVALKDKRDFNVSEAQFQQTLTTVRHDFEDRLAQICGTFKANGDVYPAIPEYAELTDRTKALGDPCGFVDNGELYSAILELEKIRVDAAQLSKKMENLNARVEDENKSASEQCDTAMEVAKWRIDSARKKAAIQASIDTAAAAVNGAKDALDEAGDLGEITKCSAGPGGTDCPTSAVSASIYVGLKGALKGVEGAATDVLKQLYSDLSDIDPEEITNEELDKCQAAESEIRYVVADLLREYSELEIAGIKTQLDIKLALGKIIALRNEATAVSAQQTESTSLAINVAAAFTDPNTRIYKNSAIIAAEQTFSDAVRQAYVATKVYEYYTSQSYPDLGSLFLIRMVEAGDYPLDQYLRELGTAFDKFEMEFGNPDSRVQVVSLRDDILDIPRLSPSNVALTMSERQDLFRTELKKSRYRDAQGRLNFPFRTALEKLSPRTNDHKIKYLEAEVVPHIGDNQARVYLVQKGTGVVRGVDGTPIYYSLPERTAVLDTFFEGDRPLDSNIYRNERLRDRPMVNTAWELQVDVQNEAVNSDLDLGQLDDIRLYFYYSDFTSQ